MAFHNKFQYIKKNDFKSDYQYLTMTLVLYFKGFTFAKELINDFNLTKSQIQTYSEKLSKKGFLVVRPFAEIDEIDQFAAFEGNPYIKKVYDNNQKVYVITENGKELMKGKIEEALKQNKDNDNTKDTILRIIEKTKNYRLIKNKILDVENKIYTRRIVYPCGLTIERRTLKGQLLDQEKQKAFLEVRKEILIGKQKQNLLTQSESKQLAQIQKGELILYDTKKQINKGVTYNGVNMSESEFEEIIKQDNINQIEIENAVKKDEDHKRKTQLLEEENKKYMSELGGGLTFKRNINLYDDDIIEETPKSNIDRLFEGLDL